MSRPVGSKNRPKEIIEAEKHRKEYLPKKGRGRPKGSLNKPKKVVVGYDDDGKPITKRKNRGYTMSEKALAQRQEGRMIKDPKTEEDIAYNARLIQHIMDIHEIAAHADRNDVNTLKSCFVAYLQLCQKNGFAVSNLAAYASMGFDFPGFNMFIKRNDPEVREFGRLVKETCGMFRENAVSTNKLNPVIGIFWQRNYDGLRNDTEQVQAAIEQDEDYSSGSKAYKEKYKNLIGE